MEERLTLLKSEWSPKNEYPFETYARSSKYKAKWTHIHECGRVHEWDQTINKRVYSGHDCSLCSGYGSGEICYCKSIECNYPILAIEWSRDNLLSSAKVSANSNRTFKWKCIDCGHEWNAKPNDRVGRGIGCPACSNNSIHMDKRNSLAVKFPNLAKDWGPGNTLKPDEVLPYSGRDINWQCYRCLGEWIAKPNDRANGNGCPYCANQRIHKDGRNSLEKLLPGLVLDWDPNNTIKPGEVTIGSDKKVSWICRTCKEQWDAKIYDRSFNKHGCPFCSNKRIYRDGRNSLEKLMPELVEEWNPENKIKPSEVTIGSGKKVSWICRLCKEKWNATIRHRTTTKTGCPLCKKNRGETLIENILKEKNIEYIREKSIVWKDARHLRFDFYIHLKDKDRKIAIEFDGIQHFEPVKFFGGEDRFKLQKIYDKYKVDYCDTNDISLLRIHYKDIKETAELIDLIMRGIRPFGMLVSSKYPEPFPWNI